MDEKQKEKLEEIDEILARNMCTAFLPSYLVTNVEDAVLRAKKYGCFIALAEVLEKFPDEVAANPEACRLIASKLRGEDDRRGKPGIEQLKNDLRDLHVLGFIYYAHKGAGMGIKKVCNKAHEFLDRTKDFETISPDTIYLHIWRKHEKEGYMKEHLAHFRMEEVRGRRWLISRGVNKLA